MRSGHRTVWLAVIGSLTIVSGCGDEDDPKRATGDELPLVEDATVIHRFEVPNGIVNARVLYQVVTGASDQKASELLEEQRALLKDEGWALRPDDQARGAWVIRASDDHVEDFIRFGTVAAMRMAAMSRSDRRRLDVPRDALVRSMIVQISPPGPPPSE
jgi:hypothetical protein